MHICNPQFTNSTMGLNAVLLRISHRWGQSGNRLTTSDLFMLECQVWNVASCKLGFTRGRINYENADLIVKCTLFFVQNTWNSARSIAIWNFHEATHDRAVIHVQIYCPGGDFIDYSAHWYLIHKSSAISREILHMLYQEYNCFTTRSQKFY